MPNAFDARNPPFDRLDAEEIDRLRAELDIGYFAPEQVIVAADSPAAYNFPDQGTAGGTPTAAVNYR